MPSSQSSDRSGVSTERDDLDPVEDIKPISVEDEKRFSNFTKELQPLCSTFYYDTIRKVQYGEECPVEDRSDGSIVGLIRWETDDDLANVLDLCWRETFHDSERDAEAVQRSFQAIQRFENATNTRVSSSAVMATNPSTLAQLLSGVMQSTGPSELTKLDHDGTAGYEWTITAPDGSVAVFSWREDLERVRVKMSPPKRTEQSTTAEQQASTDKKVPDQVVQVPVEGAQPDE